MNSSETFAIRGAGLAAAKAAETLREEGFDGRRATHLRGSGRGAMTQRRFTTALGKYIVNLNV